MINFRLQLLRDPSVRFAGYRIPHPLTFECHIKVQTIDSRTTPMKVFDLAIQDLLMEIEHIEKEFETALNNFEHSY